MAKQIIDNKIYDTGKSTKVASDGYATIYLTKNGNWFLHPKPQMTDQDIKPITSKEAYNWLHKHAEVKAINKYFPGTIEEA